jgi:hypothetical protein
VAATVTDILGLGDGAVFPGPSLKALWDSPQPPSRWPDPLSELAQFKYESPKFPSHHGAMTSLVTPEYHYMFHQRFGTELYDMMQDPAENANLAETPQGQTAALALAAQIRNRTVHPR